MLGSHQWRWIARLLREISLASPRISELPLVQAALHNHVPHFRIQEVAAYGDGVPEALSAPVIGNRVGNKFVATKKDGEPPDG